MFQKWEQKIEHKIKMIKLYQSKKSNNRCSSVRKKKKRTNSEEEIIKEAIQNFPELKDMSLQIVQTQPKD